MKRGELIEAPLFTGFAQVSFEGLLSALSKDTLLVADLSAVSSEGFSAAHQLAGQLQLELSSNIFGRSVNQSSSPSERVAAWVDAEGRGDALIAKAHALAVSIAAAASEVNAQCLIILPVSGKQVCEEENWFIYFLASALSAESEKLSFLCGEGLAVGYAFQGLKIKLASAGIEDDATDLSGEISPLFAIFPGVLNQQQVVQLASEGLLDNVALLPLLGGHYLIAPAHRRVITDLSDEELSLAYEHALLLPDNVSILAGLDLFKLERGLNIGLPLSELVASAWRLCGEGGLDTAEYFFGVIAAYLKRHSYDEYLAVAVEMQSFRISAQRFNLAATFEEPDQQLGDTRLCQDVFFTLGWARVLSGDPAGAADAFSRAGHREIKSAANAIDLYLLNIYALSLLRNGDWDAAMRIELDISKRLAILPEPDWHLTYINNFNLARLYRIHGEYDDALSHIRLVLATTEGLQTDSDHIYFNLTLGDLESRRERHAESLVYLWRAAMHFLCNPVPEAIGWRTLMSLMGRRDTVDSKMPHFFAAALCDKLAGAAGQVGVAITEGESETPFYYSEHGLGLGNEACTIVRSSHLGALVVSPEDFGNSSYDSPAYKRLRSLAIQVFEAFSFPGWSLPAGSIMFSPASVVELDLKAPSEFACLALKYGIKNSVSAECSGEALDLDKLSRNIWLNLTPAIASVVKTSGDSGASVSFKRYRETLELRGWGPGLVLALSQGGAMTIADAIAKQILKQDETGLRGLGHQLGRLESQGVITLRFE